MTVIISKNWQLGNYTGKHQPILGGLGTKLAIGLKSKISIHCSRPANSGGSWEPSSKIVLELQESFEQNMCTFCQKISICLKLQLWLIFDGN